jgi:hypothetical protein
MSWDPFKPINSNSSSAFEPMKLDCMENRPVNFYDSYDNRSDWGSSPQNWAYSTSLSNSSSSFQSYGFSPGESKQESSWGKSSWGWESNNWGSSNNTNQSSWAFSPVTGNTGNSFNPFLPTPQAPKTIFPSSEVKGLPSPFQPVGFEAPKYGKLKR